jgi:hypothetical protein
MEIFDLNDSDIYLFELRNKKIKKHIRGERI